LNAVIAATPVRAELVAEPDGGYAVVMTPLASEWRELAVRELAGAFASLLRQSFPPRLKLCANCGAAFWDGTRSRTRRWCDSRTCGNRVRVRRHRERR
jgi:predicted RNA-binding Zn ribbon-like protein